MNQHITNEPALAEAESGPETHLATEVDFTVAPADESALDRYGIVLRDRLFETVADYKTKAKEIGRANSDLKDIRATLTYELALLKAVHVGRGRDGDWGDYLKAKFGLKRRTVDRWIKKEVSQGQLPPWASQKLIANMDPDPAPKPEQPIFALTLTFKTIQDRDIFATHCGRVDSDRLRQIIFEAVTLHKETQADYEPTVLSFLDDEPEPVVAATDVNDLVAQAHGLQAEAAGVAA
jgi:hypothetical protein